MKTIQLTLTPEEAARKLPFSHYRIVRRSVDARQKQIKVLLTVDVFEEGEEMPELAYQPPVYQDVSHARYTVVIVGAGPAGLFAALSLLEHGVKPIILERGKDVSSRKRDIAQLNQNKGLNLESNYCFGEGGAGTFSDGKLFSRSKKRGNMQRIMELFHYFGADDSILYETHAHIGSDRLPQIIKSMRETIISHGGEVHFEERVTGLKIENSANSESSETSNIQLSTINFQLSPDAVIFATGHSAADTYELLQNAGVKLEPKGFAMGVRVEHPQELINKLMYHQAPPSGGWGASIGNAAYSLVTQVNGRGVYSFCMCPGGHIVPAATGEEHCVVNGMSVKKRNSPFANSGIVVEIRPEDIPADYQRFGALAGLHFQQAVEHLAYSHATTKHSENSENSEYSESAKAPAQRLRDFVEGKPSKDLPKTSYLPGVIPSRLDQWLPPMIGKRLQQGFRDFDKKYHGFLTNEAIILGVESRSSSAVRISRHDTLLCCLNESQRPLRGIYAAGEGAGFAGGITSSAMDGIRIAEKICEELFK